VAGSALASLLVAAFLSVSLAAALGLVALIAAGTFVLRGGLMGVALLLVAVLPWLVVFSAVEPKLTETFTAGVTVAILLVVAAPRHDGSRTATRLQIGMILFYAPVIFGLARNPGGAQFIEASKYIVFPFATLAVILGTNLAALRQLSKVAFASGAIAVTANLLLGVAGLNHSNYRAGDIQGLAGEHDLALLAGAVTAASLGMAMTIRTVGVSVVGTIATIATGVRSTLPGLLLIVLARMSRAGARARTIIVVGVVSTAVLVSGVANVVARRYTHAQQTGQFSSFAAFGSGRGELYTAAIHAWWVSTPVEWVVGKGLRSIEAVEKRATGSAGVSQNDVIQIGVETGLIGLLGYVLLWWALLARARSKLPLLILLPFSLFNGALEYGAPLVITLLLTVGSGEQSDEFHAAAEPRARSQVGAELRGPAAVG
jgi:O-Antigen ligase